MKIDSCALASQSRRSRKALKVRVLQHVTALPGASMQRQFHCKPSRLRELFRPTGKPFRHGSIPCFAPVANTTTSPDTLTFLKRFVLFALVRPQYNLLKSERQSQTMREMITKEMEEYGYGFTCRRERAEQSEPRQYNAICWSVPPKDLHAFQPVMSPEPLCMRSGASEV